MSLVVLDIECIENKIVKELGVYQNGQTPEKAANECCLIENPRHFFNLDCKSVFNTFCPVHKFCVWDFVDSVPKCE